MKRGLVRTPRPKAREASSGRGLAYPSWASWPGESFGDFASPCSSGCFLPVVESFIRYAQMPDDTSQTRNADSPPDNSHSSDSSDLPSASEDFTDEDIDNMLSRVADLEEKVDELKSERDQLNEKLLRKAAEFDNYRRRMDREQKRRYEAGKVDVIEPLLEVVDDFERSLDAAQDLEGTEDPEAAYSSLKGGVEMVFRKLRDTLETLGVEPIDAEGHPFDETVHEAMMRQPTNDVEPGTVLQEVRRGYRMGDRIVRHSRVVVAGEATGDDAGPEPGDAGETGNQG